PTITQQPVSLNVAAGATATFTVTASGTPPLHFQWRFNGSTVAGATNASLALADVQAINAGNYQVVVANDVGSITSVVATLTLVVLNGAGSVTSAVATLAVSGLPIILQRPADLDVRQGNSATFNVTVSGTAPLAFQWRLNGTPLPGATNATLTLTNVQPANAGD